METIDIQFRMENSFCRHFFFNILGQKLKPKVNCRLIFRLTRPTVDSKPQQF